MLKENSSFNKVLNKLFKRKLVYKKGVIWDCKVNSGYQCFTCKEKNWKIPKMDKDEYYYSLKEKFTLKEQIKLDDEELKVYGWIVEMKGKTYDWQRWENYWNKKVYHSRIIAMEALNQVSNIGYFNDYEFRIRPLYEVDNQYYRNIKISKLLKINKK
jgi:hypothetical protein